MFFSHGTNHSKGVMILINPSLECKIEKCITDKNGRFIILKLSFDEQSIVLVNIYAPNDVQQQLKFFSTLNQLLQEFAEEKILIAGEFNCALSPKDKIGGKSVTRKASVIKQIETLCASHNLRDIWRNINPELSRFTWRNKSLKIQCRLDYFLISEDLCNLTKTCDILLAPESDHSAISIHIQSDSSAQKKGPGFWKFNTALLEDESYTAALRENILTFKAKYADVADSGLKWDLIKMEIRGFTVKYSKRKAKRTRDKEKALQERINTLQAQAEKHPHNRSIILELQVEKSRLKKIMAYKTKGAILRSKVRWQNLRPISLVNVDYKILTKAIAKRVEKVLPDIINVDQTGYVKGRYIGENIRLIQDVIHFTSQMNEKGIAIFLNFKKAFDMIEWTCP